MRFSPTAGCPVTMLHVCALSRVRRPSVPSVCFNPIPAFVEASALGRIQGGCCARLLRSPLMYLPRTIIHGGGSIRRLGALLGDMGLKRPLVVADKFLASPQSGAVDKVCDSLSASGAPFEVFTDTIPDPTTESVERCVDALAAGNFDSIVALGGGSPMDTAKAAAVLFKQGGRMRDYKAPFQNDGATLPMIAIPTTAGTGSEATKFTIVTDSETQEKMLCAGPPPPLPAPTAGQPRKLVTSAPSHAGARAWRTCPSRPSSTTSSL